MTLSAPDKFLVQEIHGGAVFLFNKEGRVRIPPLDAEAFVRRLLDRRRRLAERMELFGPFVPKEVLRRLERLAFVTDPDDLAAKYEQALAWFREAIGAIDETQVLKRASRK